MQSHQTTGASELQKPKLSDNAGGTMGFIDWASSPMLHPVNERAAW
jgi:hypothetical protein